MKKKKKRENGAEEAGWATAHLSSFRSRYNVLYHDRHGLGAPGGSTRPSRRARACSGMPRYGQDGPRYGQDGPRHGRPRVRACSSARAQGLAGRVCHDTIVCIVTGGRPSR